MLADKSAFITHPSFHQFVIRFGLTQLYLLRHCQQIDSQIQTAQVKEVAWILKTLHRSIGRGQGNEQLYQITSTTNTRNWTVFLHTYRVSFVTPPITNGCTQAPEWTRPVPSAQELGTSTNLLPSGITDLLKTQGSTRRTTRRATRSVVIVRR